MQEHTVYKRKSAIFFLPKKFSKAAHFHKRQIPHPVFLIDLQVSTTCLDVYTLKGTDQRRGKLVYFEKKCLRETQFGIIRGSFS